MDDQNIGNEVLGIKNAIQISKILATAPDERIPMILSVLEKADMVINGLDELEEWKALKDQAYLVDVNEFVEALKVAFPEEGDSLKVPVKQFGDFCRERNMKPSLIKRLLARHGFLVPSADKEKLEYTETIWKDGKAVRCVVISKRKMSGEYGNGK